MHDYQAIKEIEKFLEELADAEDDYIDDYEYDFLPEKYLEPPDSPIERIAVGVIKKRVSGFNIPFIEHHALIVKTPNGFISFHYERNKNRPILNRCINLNDWELTKFYTPKDGITMADLFQNVGNFWIFPKFRFVQKILSILFEQRIVNMLRREWAKISLVRKTLVKIKLIINSGVEWIMTHIKRIFSRFFQ
ncbi:unnamed protein product [Rhizophagus irregularis]|uniref:Uncharacterized protein n=1 Tax=Rhizophagus irregularis TaxID=588596 RepID=A0A915ZCD4_9GLOM|nr:unnamed protein product [Rhizophagus irregularis]